MLGAFRARTSSQASCVKVTRNLQKINLELNRKCWIGTSTNTLVLCNHITPELSEWNLILEIFKVGKWLLVS